MAAYNFKDTTAYKKAFALAMEIFEVSKSFPKEEKFSLGQKVIKKCLCKSCRSIQEEKIPCQFYFQTNRFACRKFRNRCMD
jgi:23S rRNA-intervening sequence protein